jgi:ferredoxin
VKLTVDRDLCEGVGMCQSMAHEFFEVDDDDIMHILDETPAEEHRPQIRAAVESCPVLALTVTPEG